MNKTILTIILSAMFLSQCKEGAKKTQTTYYQNIDQFGDKEWMKNVVELKLIIRGDSAFGVYNDYPSEKDSREGSFKGTIKDSVVLGTYIYHQEGEISEEPLQIVIKNDKVIVTDEIFTETIKRVPKFK